MHNDNLKKNLLLGEAIILGANHHNTYGIIRALHKVGITPIIVCFESDSKSNYFKSKYVKQIYTVNKYNLYEWLLEFGKNSSVKHTIFSSGDYFTSVLDANANILSKYYYFPHSDEEGKLNKLMDKQLMSDLASGCGLNIPLHSRIIAIHDNTLNISELRGGYPYIIKPLKSIEGSKADIFIANSEQDLNKYIVNAICHSFQIQSFIDKAFEFQLIGVSIGNEIIIPGVTKLLWSSSFNTNTGIVEYIPSLELLSDGLIERVCNFVRKTGYQGSFSVEFLKGRDGKEYFMEINFRNDGNSIVMTGSGINYHQIWYYYNNGIPYENLLKAETRKTIAIPFFSMLSPARKQHRIIDLIKYSFSCNCNRIFMDIDLSDTKPFKAFIQTKLKNRLKRR